MIPGTRQVPSTTNRRDRKTFQRSVSILNFSYCLSVLTLHLISNSRFLTFSHPQNTFTYFMTESMDRALSTFQLQHWLGKLNEKKKDQPTESHGSNHGAKDQEVASEAGEVGEVGEADLDETKGKPAIFANSVDQLAPSAETKQEASLVMEAMETEPDLQPGSQPGSQPGLQGENLQAASTLGKSALESAAISGKFSSQLVPCEIKEVESKCKHYRKTEDALYFNGTKRGRELAQGMIGSTASFYEYTLFTKDFGPFRQECEKLGFGFEYKQCSQLAEPTMRFPRKFTSIQRDELIAVGMYTSNRFFLEMNKAFGDSNVMVDKYCQLLSLLIKGFRNLPPHRETVYRAAVMNPMVYQENKIILWPSVTSCCTSREAAQDLLSGSTGSSTGLMKRGESKILFCIESKTGRHIAELSCFPLEREVIFLPYSTFQITKVSKDEEKDFTLVHMTEAYPDVRGRRILLWVDDVSLNNYQMMNKAQENDVTIVELKNTRQACDFLSHHSFLLQRDASSFRIVSDMVRNEDGKLNYDAGLQLMQILQQKYGYQNKMVVFTGISYLSANRKKFQDARLDHVLVTSTASIAEQFACFM